MMITEKASTVISHIITALSNCALYSSEHSAVGAYSRRAVDDMAPFFEDGGDLSFTILGDSLFVNEDKVPDKSGHITKFVKVLRRKGVEKVIFTSSIEPGELAAFVESMASASKVPASTGSLKVGVVEVRLSTGEGVDISSVMDEDIEKLREVHEGLSKFKTLDMVGLEDIVASFISTFRQEANALNIISPLKTYDDYTFTHTANVSVLSIFQAQSVGIQGEMLHEVGLAGLLHDVGKQFVPLEILNKPGKLDDREWDYMRNHTVLGAKYLSSLKDSPKLAIIAAYEHHLKFDGSGYPVTQRRDKNQHLISQIIAISDFFDALRTERPYRKAMPIEKIVSIMEEGTGSDFNPVLVKNFVRTLIQVGEFTPSSDRPSQG
jgi:HD-GYP domain-containing protein (c-di-GMP phosphodiesterase class II)